MEGFRERDSGWSLVKIWFLKINFNKYNPINVGLSTYIDVPALLGEQKVYLI